MGRGTQPPASFSHGKVGTQPCHRGQQFGDEAHISVTLQDWYPGKISQASQQPGFKPGGSSDEHPQYITPLLHLICCSGTMAPCLSSISPIAAPSLHPIKFPHRVQHGSTCHFSASSPSPMVGIFLLLIHASVTSFF